MRYPEFLPENGKIGVVAPAFGCATEPYISLLSSASAKLNKLGHGIVTGPNVSLMEGIGISNSPDKCGEELNEFMTRDDIDVVISAGGGECMCEVVPYMDFDRISKSPAKWYQGYSDNTNYCFLSATIMDTAALYDSCIADFGMEEWHESIYDAYDFLRGKKLTFTSYEGHEREKIKSPENPLAGYNIDSRTVIKAFPDGKVEMEGRLIGGCLDCLANLVGTRFDKVRDFNDRYKDDGIIWFLEACDLNVFSIRRSLWNLKEAGWFENLRGFLIGRPLNGEEMFGLDSYKAVTDILGDFNVPILMDLDIGHVPPMMPMVEGAMAKVSFDGNEMTINYELK